MAGYYSDFENVGDDFEYYGHPYRSECAVLQQHASLRSRHLRFGEARLRYRHLKIECPSTSRSTIKRASPTHDVYGQIKQLIKKEN